MQKLPDFREISISSEEVSSSSDMAKTEEILKRLLINIEAFKKIENENIRLRKTLLENQNILKGAYKQKLEELSYAVKEKDSLKQKIKAELLSKYRSYLEKLTKETITAKEENNLLRKKYKELFILSKKTAEDNKVLKTVLQQNRELFKMEFERKLRQLTKEVKDKQLLAEASHKSLIKEHEETKIELSKKHVLEKEKNAFLVKKYDQVASLLEAREKEFKKMQLLNQKLIQRLAFLEKKSLANEEVLEARTSLISSAFEKKLKEVIKIQVDKEVDYKAKIESLTKDLAKYYNALKDSKSRYYKRERELKEKLKEFLN
jgi:hypothetical protein